MKTCIAVCMTHLPGCHLGRPASHFLWASVSGPASGDTSRVTRVTAMSFELGDGANMVLPSGQDSNALKAGACDWLSVQLRSS